jgi:hypothetical protein
MNTIKESNPEYQDNHDNREYNQTNKYYYLPDQSFLTNFHSFLISSLTLTILLFVLKPSIILNTTQLLSLSLYNF